MHSNVIFLHWASARLLSTSRSIYYGQWSRSITNQKYCIMGKYVLCICSPLQLQLIDAKLIKIGSIPPGGAFCGSILAAPLLHYIGRKRTILSASPIGIIGWILIATATRYEMIIIGRFLNGFCVGLCLPSAQVYVRPNIIKQWFYCPTLILLSYLEWILIKFLPFFSSK